MIRFRGLLFGFLGALNLATLGAIGQAGAVPANDCVQRLIGMTVSPDDRWTAYVEEETCSGPGIAATGITDIVQLGRQGSNEVQAVFAVEEHGNPRMRPQLLWLSPIKLQITIPNTSLIGFKMHQHEDVEISVRFDPDKPGEREQFLKRLGLPPD